MLTDKQKIELLDPVLTPLHHYQFIRKWIDVTDAPSYITNILHQLATMDKSERKKFYFVNDQVYYLDIQPEKLVKHATKGWITSTRYTISRKN